MTTLLPKEVPGATLMDGMSLQNHSISQLKRWLECRDLEQSGTKNELMMRIQNSIETGDDCRIFLGVDGGKWYHAKLKGTQLDERSTSKSFWEKVTWGTFPSCYIPIFFNMGHIYTYMLGIHAGPDEIRAYSSDKTFRKGHLSVGSDHLSEVEDGLYKHIYACRCKCSSPFQNTRKYEVGVTIHNISGAIMSGICQCKQTSIGKCSHIKALLRFIWDSVKDDEYNTEDSATELSQNQHQRNTSKQVEGMGSAVKKYRPIPRDTFDPRPADYTRKLSYEKLMDNLRRCDGNSLFETIYPKGPIRPKSLHFQK